MRGMEDFETGHDWRERTVWISGRLFLHRKCQVCGRDFVASQEEPRWRAVHVGLTQFDFLDDEITEQWMSEKCPGEVLPNDWERPKVPSSTPIGSKTDQPG